MTASPYQHPSPGPVPFSTGTQGPRAALPADACDCHMHLYDARWPTAPGARLTPPDAGVDDYRALQRRLGTTRTVLVTPSTYGLDNRGMLAGLAALGDSARGVAVLDDTVSDAELQRLHAWGVRGVRFNLSLGTANTPAMLGPLAERLAPLGWHLQLLMPPDQLVALQPLLGALPVDLVFDHLARIPAHEGERHPAHRAVLQLLERGRAWVKLSGGYLVSEPSAVDTPALRALACSYLRAAPERAVWGSDWPHATASAGHHPFPDDALQLDALAAWCDDDALFARVLARNPARLYGFAARSELSH